MRDERTFELGQPVHREASGVTKRIQAFKRLQPFPGGSALDVGCGTGAYTVALTGEFESLVAIDIEPDRLDEFKHSLPGTPLASKIRVMTMNAEALEFPDESFEAVMAIEVLEHIEDLDAAVGEMHRVLKPGGLMYASAPNRLFPLETHMVHLGSREVRGRLLPFLPYVPALHRRVARARNFTAGELRLLMHRHGLVEVGIDFIMPPFDRWALGRRWLRPVTDLLERTPFRRFGVSIIGVYAKAGAPP